MNGRLAGAVLALLAGCRAAEYPTARDEQTAPPTRRELSIESGDVALHTVVTGGPAATSTVVVIHGGPGLSHDYLLPLEALASAERTVVLYDQRGVGRSSAPADPRSHGRQHHVADLEAIRAESGAARLHLVAHSWGGFVAMAYAIDRPQHVASLSLVSSLPPTALALAAGYNRFGSRQERLTAAAIVPDSLPEIRDGDCREYIGAILPTYFADPRHRAAAIGLGATTCDNDVQATTWEVLGDFDLRAGLGRVAAPVLIIWGAADPFGEEWADAMGAALGTRAVVIPDCGHLPWVECAEPFWAHLGGFLDQHD